MNRNKSGMSRALVRRETTAGYLFLLPSLFFFLTFVVYPMVMCIITSFFDSNMGKNTKGCFYRPWELYRAFPRSDFSGSTEKHLYYCSGLGTGGYGLLPVGCQLHL